MQAPNPEQAGGSLGHMARLAAAAVTASWFVWQLVVLHGHIPL